MCVRTACHWTLRDTEGDRVTRREPGQKLRTEAGRRWGIVEVRECEIWHFPQTLYRDGAVQLITYMFVWTHPASALFFPNPSKPHPVILSPLSASPLSIVHIPTRFFIISQAINMYDIFYYFYYLSLFQHLSIFTACFHCIFLNICVSCEAPAWVIMREKGVVRKQKPRQRVRGRGERGSEEQGRAEVDVLAEFLSKLRPAEQEWIVGIVSCLTTAFLIRCWHLEDKRGKSPVLWKNNKHKWNKSGGNWTCPQTHI